MDQLNWLTVARKYFHKGNLEQSLTVIDQHLQTCPTSLSGLELKTLILKTLERYGEAQETNQKLLRWVQIGVASDELNWLKSAEDFFEAGLFRDHQEDWQAASNLFKKVTELEPDYYEAWEALGSAFFSLERFEEALSSFERVIEIMPGSAEAWYEHGVCLSELGRKAEAINSYNRALAENLYFSEAWNNKGSLQVELKQYEEAILSFSQALDIDPQSSMLWTNYGLAFYKSNQFEKAISSFEAAVGVDSENDKAWSCLGKAFASLEQYENATVALKNAVNLQPNDFEHWLNLGVFFRNTGRLENARDAYMKVIDLNSNCCQAHTDLGVILNKFGLFEDAIVSIDQAIHIDIEDHFAWIARASIICDYVNSRYEYAAQTPSFLQELTILYQPEPHIAALQEGSHHVTAQTPNWAIIHLQLGDVYLKHSELKHNPMPFWRDALRSYEKAYEVLKPESFPIEYLQVLQGLIRTHLLLSDVVSARAFQKEGLHLFQQLRDEQPLPLKTKFEAKFSSFSQLEIDLLIGENDPISALEQAEFYKNRCLTWILDGWQDTTLSVTYKDITSLLSSDTAILFWHLSQDNLTTFILLDNHSSPLILKGSTNSEGKTVWYQQAEQFWEWIKEFDRNYRDYASKKPSKDFVLSHHLWFRTLEKQLAELQQILKVDEICRQLPNTIERLILVPHRDLHRLPIQSLFPEQFTCTYLPSFQIGLTLQQEDWSRSISPLLSIDDPQTEKPAMPFAQLESAVIRLLVDEAEHINGDAASLHIVTQALESNAYQIVHFTGHGAYNSRNPGNSAIELTDELLTAKHISHIDLSSCYLVCLAACETALTGQESVSTEYVGLPSAFLKAGAANVLSTLWVVDEVASAWIMIYFFQQLLSGTTPSHSLQAAQKWMKTVTWAELADWLIRLSQLPGLSAGIVDLLRARANNTLKEGSTIGLNQPTKYHHPSYWAAFTLTGRG